MLTECVIPTSPHTQLWEPGSSSPLRIPCRCSWFAGSCSGHWGIQRPSSCLREMYGPAGKIGHKKMTECTSWLINTVWMAQAISAWRKQERDWPCGLGEGEQRFRWRIRALSFFAECSLKPSLLPQSGQRSSQGWVYALWDMDVLVFYDTVQKITP